MPAPDLSAKNFAYSLLTIKSTDDERRQILGIATTPEPDRIGDIVEPLGVKFTNPLPLLWQHKTDKPVGLVRFKKPTADGIEFIASLPKVDEPGVLKDRVDEAWQSIKHNLVRGVSIGFKAVEASFMDDGGVHFLQSEVFELSLVTIPANASATIQQIKSIDEQARAASGRAVVEPSRRLGVIAKSPEGKPMAKKTFAEQISAFEATRVAKSARMAEIMNAAADEDGDLQTLDTEQKAEYDGLEQAVTDIDEHLVRLRKHEAVTRAAAVAVVAPNLDDAGKIRGGVRVEGVKANLPQGIPFVRYVIALAASQGNPMMAAEFAKKWRDQTPEVETCLKAAVAAGTTTATTWAAPLVEYQFMSNEFIEYLRPRTIIGQIPGLRRVPFKIKVPRQTAASSVNWIGEGRVKPVSALAFDSIVLEHYKIAGIVALTEELVRFSNPSAEALVREDLASSVIEFMDLQFVDPTKSAAVGVSPASVTNGVTPVPATGTTASAFRKDVKTLFGAFLAADLSPESSVFIMTQTQALALSLMQNPLGQQEHPGMTMTGGTLVGLPVIASENIPATGGSPANGSPLILMKASEVMLADDGMVTIDASREATLQMDNAPDSPATAATVAVSLWQHNLIGIRAERFINWLKRRPEAVQYISYAKYAE